MSFGEHANFNQALGKLVNTCKDNGLLCSVVGERYPFVVNILTDVDAEGQTSMFDADEEDPMELRFIFLDGRLFQKAQNLTIDDSLLKKLRGLVQKLYTAYTAAFFRDAMDQRASINADAIDQNEE